MAHMAILGAGGHGKVVADIAATIGWTEITFFDDELDQNYSSQRYKVAGSTNSLIESYNEVDGVFVAIGNNAKRKQKLDLFFGLDAPITNIVHRNAYLSEFISIGLGTVVMPGVMVNCDTKVGMGAILNTNSNIDHDCELGNYVHIAPGVSLAGNVIVGDNVLIGIGSCIKQDLKIGINSLVGAGSVVVCDVKEGTTVKGNPAR